jgi:hypothetical protein
LGPVGDQTSLFPRGENDGDQFLNQITVFEHVEKHWQLWVHLLRRMESLLQYAIVLDFLLLRHDVLGHVRQVILQELSLHMCNEV